MMTTSKQMTRIKLLEAVRRLPERTPITSALFPGADGKRTWVSWVTNYAKDDDISLRNQRDARFIYNNWWNAPRLVWLAEASGIDQDRVQRAATVALEGKNSKHKAEAIRQILPWELVASHLERLNGKRTSKHFVAYHNRDEFGPYLRKSKKKPKEGKFFTAKQFREETLAGQHLWVFEGSGSPRRYKLVAHGVLTRLNTKRRPSGYRSPSRQYGTDVRFKIDESHQPTDVTNFLWFRRLLRQQQSFRNGFNSMNDNTIVRSLQRLEYTGMDDSLTRGNFRNDAAIDVNQIKRTIRKKTTREALIDARLGQGKFRAEVGDRWDNVCAVTGCGIIELLRASHIKPWRASTNPEALTRKTGFCLRHMLMPFLTEV
jgi:hypothetical protein